MMRKAYYPIIIILLLSGILFFQTALTRYTSKATWKTENLAFFPVSERLRPALLGFDVTVSHCLWIKTVLYFGGHYLTDRNYQWLIQMVDIVTRLNPNFYPAYEFAGIIIPETCHNPDAARVILERGFSHLGSTKWNVGFYLGMIYYKYYADNVRAAEYIRMAALAEGAPVEKLVSIAASFYSQAGKAAVGIQLLKLTIESSQNPEVRNFLSGKVQRILQQQQKNSRS